MSFKIGFVAEETRGENRLKNRHECFLGEEFTRIMGLRSDCFGGREKPMLNDFSWCVRVVCVCVCV